MKTIFLMLISFCSIAAYAQDSSGQNMKVETRDAFYPGGDQALTDHLITSMTYTDDAKAHKVQGDMMVSFWVEADSSVMNIKVISDLGHGCAESLKTVLSKVKFSPALVNGIAMRSKVMVTVPVRAH